MLERCPKASVWGPASPQVPVITFMGVEEEEEGLRKTGCIG